MVGGCSQWHLGQNLMKCKVGPSPLKTMLNSTLGLKHLPPLFSLHLSSLLFPAQQATLPRMKSLDVKSFLSVLAGEPFYLFSKKPFYTSGIFPCLLWEVASSFPKNVLHPLFKQGALEELWTLKEG